MPAVAYVRVQPQIKPLFAMINLLTGLTSQYS